jgi:hypothetical protein
MVGPRPGSIIWGPTEDAFKGMLYITEARTGRMSKLHENEDCFGPPLGEVTYPLARIGSSDVIIDSTWTIEMPAVAQPHNEGNEGRVVLEFANFHAEQTSFDDDEPEVIAMPMSREDVLYVLQEGSIFKRAEGVAKAPWNLGERRQPQYRGYHIPERSADAYQLWFGRGYKGSSSVDAEHLLPY